MKRFQVLRGLGAPGAVGKNTPARNDYRQPGACGKHWEPVAQAAAGRFPSAGDETMSRVATTTAFSVSTITKEIVESVVTGGASPQEVLERLNSYGIEWYLTEKGDLPIKYWQVGAEDFVPAEHVARIREGRAVPNDASTLEWLSQQLPELRKRYADHWIAVVENEVVAAAPTLPDLLQRIRDAAIEHPFITEIPSQPLIWTTTYAG